MKVYVAANTGQESEVRAVRDKLLRASFEVALDLVTASRPEDLDNLSKQTFAIQDLAEVQKADALFLFHTFSGGQEKFAELGMALALGKKCIIVAGPSVKDCIFFYLPHVRVVDSVEKALFELERWRKE